MDRRDAAQRSRAEIERFAVHRTDRRLDRDGGVVRVRNQPQTIAAIELAGLRRNIRSGETQAKIRRQYTIAVLGQHFPIPFTVEAIDQHSIEAADLSELTGRHCAALFQPVQLLQLLDEMSDARIERFERFTLGGRRLLELEDHALGGTMPEHLQVVPIDHGRAQQRSIMSFVPLADLACEPRATHVSQGLLQEIAAEVQDRGCVETGLQDPELGVADQQRAVGLNIAGNADGLASAAFQGEIVIRGHTRFPTDHTSRVRPSSTRRAETYFCVQASPFRKGLDVAVWDRSDTYNAQGTSRVPPVADWGEVHEPALLCRVRRLATEALGSALAASIPSRDQRESSPHLLLAGASPPFPEGSFHAVCRPWADSRTDAGSC